MNKVLIDNDVILETSEYSLCNNLLDMNVAKGDTIYLEPFTENDGNYTEYYHCKHLEVSKVIKILKRTWNNQYIKSLEVHLVTVGES